MENHSLIEKIRKRDGDDTLKEIYDQYRNEFVLWAMRHHSCSAEEAREVFQQSMVIFYENVIHGKLTEITVQVKTYLFSIGKNKILEVLRKRGKAILHVEDQIYSESDMQGHEIDDEFEDRLKMVEDSMFKMGDPCKSILKYYYYHKKTMKEISEIMGYKNDVTVKNLKYKCLKRLKQIFNSEFSLDDSSGGI